jgi:hypothetical protein
MLITTFLNPFLLNLWPFKIKIKCFFQELVDDFIQHQPKLDLTPEKSKWYDISLEGFLK